MILSGIKILEIEGLGPAPFASMLLADLGADVIVVHRKDKLASPMPNQPIVDRGKRSIELDLKQPESIKILKKLVANVDALIEGFRPGVMEKLGLGPDICLKLNPSLIYGRLTGWGQTGAYSQNAGHDLNYISLSGAAWYSSNLESEPFPPPTLVGDIAGGSLYLTIGILSGILNARKTGKGCVVDAAIFDGSAHMMNLLMTLRQNGSLSDNRGESLLDAPHWSHTYETSDGGYMSVQCLEPKFYAIFIGLLGFADDEEFKHQYDKELWPSLTERLKEIFKSKTRDEWDKLFGGSDSCVTPVLTPKEAYAHPHNQARQAWCEVDGILQAAPAPKFSGQAEWQPKPVPKRGQHSQEIIDQFIKGGDF